MEFLKVNENKLKIMLSAEDMERFMIDPSHTDYDDPEVRRAFWRVLDEAKEQCDFRISGDKVLMQFYPSGAGGELFVTKLGRIAAGTERTISKSSSVAMISERRVIYRFLSVDELILFARRLSDGDVKLSADLYSAEDGSYYLVTEERSVSGFLSEPSIVGEFATEVPASLEPYIIEHSALVRASDALAVLSQL